MKIALDLGADYIATGHYCRKGTLIKNNKETYQLLAGKDPNKDQSYFLCQLSQEQLSKTLFPIGELLKPEVRKIAKEQGMPEKTFSSQAITLLQEYDWTGNIRELRNVVERLIILGEKEVSVNDIKLFASK